LDITIVLNSPLGEQRKSDVMKFSIEHVRLLIKANRKAGSIASGLSDNQQSHIGNDVKGQKDDLEQSEE
jgi:hypothetical protein